MLNILQDKSECNFQAADMLLTTTYHSSVIHCSYYSSFQLAKYFVLEYAVAESKRDNFIKSTLKGQSSHNKYITKLISEIGKNSNRDVAKKLNNTILELKKKRKEADYDTIKIEKEDAKKAFETTKKINALINKVINNETITDFFD